MGISHLTNKLLKNVKQSAVSDHLLTCDCKINFDDFTILSKDSNNINLLIKESLLISRDKPILKNGFLFKKIENFSAVCSKSKELPLIQAGKFIQNALVLQEKIL